MGNEFAPELIKKAKSAKSAAELIALAKENGIELTNEEAADYFVKLNPKCGDISDEELTNVAGGGCYNDRGEMIVFENYSCEYWSPRDSTGNPAFPRCAKCSYCYTCFHQMTCNHPAHYA